MSERAEQAKAYQAIRRKISIFSLFLSPAILLILLVSGWTFLMRQNSIALSGDNEWLVVANYFFLFTIFQLIFELPLSYYSSFSLEHKFKLSNQTFLAWAKETLKKITLSFFLSLVLIETLYFFIRQFPNVWWILAWCGYAFVSYVMGKVFPVFIVPLFYKYSDLKDDLLKRKIFALAERFKMPIKNIYSINLSLTTKKANAAFMGLGKTKRIVLSDTLIENFTHEEIEMVLAHEIGHFKNHDVWRFLTLGLIASFVVFYVGFLTMNAVAVKFSIQTISDIAGLPLLFLIFCIMNLMGTPILNGYSRRREYAADAFALLATKNLGVFISCMKKLESQNLADPEPPVWYEWFFYDHPSIPKRIARAKK